MEKIYLQALKRLLQYKMENDMEKTSELIMNIKLSSEYGYFSKFSNKYVSDVRVDISLLKEKHSRWLYRDSDKSFDSGGLVHSIYFDYLILNEIIKKISQNNIEHAINNINAIKNIGIDSVYFPKEQKYNNHDYLNFNMCLENKYEPYDDKEYYKDIFTDDKYEYVETKNEGNVLEGHYKFITAPAFIIEKSFYKDMYHKNKDKYIKHDMYIFNLLFDEKKLPKKLTYTAPKEGILSSKWPRKEI